MLLVRAYDAKVYMLESIHDRIGYVLHNSHIYTMKSMYGKRHIFEVLQMMERHLRSKVNIIRMISHIDIHCFHSIVHT